MATNKDTDKEPEPEEAPQIETFIHNSSKGYPCVLHKGVRWYFSEGTKKSMSEDDLYFETFYHRSGKQYQCIYEGGMRFYQDRSMNWQPFPLKWYNKGRLETTAVISDSGNKEIAKKFAKLCVEGNKSETNPFDVTDKSVVQKEALSKPDSESSSDTFLRTVYSHESASDEVRETCFNPSNPFTRGSSSDEVELKFDDGQSLYPSKALLAQASPVFEKQFQTDVSDNDRSVIELKRKDYDAFLVLLLNLHPRIQKPISDHHAKIIYEYAFEYQIPPVLSKCEDILLKKICCVRKANKSDISNVWEMLIFSEKYGNENLLSECVDYISSLPYKDITENHKYMEASDATKNKILTRQIEKYVHDKK